jgi:hypothetical protein
MPPFVTTIAGLNTSLSSQSIRFFVIGSKNLTGEILGCKTGFTESTFSKPSNAQLFVLSIAGCSFGLLVQAEK